MERRVQRVVTPGTLAEESLLAPDRDSSLAGLKAGRWRLGHCLAEPHHRRVRSGRRQRCGRTRRRFGAPATGGSTRAGEYGAGHCRPDPRTRCAGVRCRAGVAPLNGALWRRGFERLRAGGLRRRNRRRVRGAALRAGRALPGPRLCRPAGQDVGCGCGGHGRADAPQSGNRPALRRRDLRHALCRDGPHGDADGRPQAAQLAECAAARPHGSEAPPSRRRSRSRAARCRQDRPSAAQRGRLGAHRQPHRPRQRIAHAIWAGCAPPWRLRQSFAS